MRRNRLLAAAIVVTVPVVTGMAVPLHAASLAPLKASCTIGASEEAGKFRVQIDKGDCNGERHCGSNFSNESLSRFTGITLADLGREGTKLTATLSGRAGDIYLLRHGAQWRTSRATRCSRPTTHSLPTWNDWDSRATIPRN